MKRRLTYIFILLSFALQVNADHLGYTKEHPLIFGIDMDYPPMQYVDADGIPHGFDVEFTKRLMKRLNIPFTYAPNTWENIADDILQGRVDLGMMVFSPYRKDITNYSRAVFRLYYQMVFRKSDQDNRDYGLRDVKGRTIAFMNSRPVKDTLQKCGANIVLVKDLGKAISDLSKGQYDAVICFRYQSKYLIEKNKLTNLETEDLTLAPREYCYVSHDKRLIESINNMIDQMDKEGEIDDVYGKVRSQFGGLIIPLWIWGVLIALIIVSLLTIIYLQRKSKKRLEEEMERARKNEERALKSEKLKTIFLSNVSHALRTPLNAIIGFSDLMLTAQEEDIPAPERQNLMGLINENGLQLLHLINELLSLSDIENKEKFLNRQVTDIDQEMSRYASEIRMQLYNGVKLETVEPIGGIRALVDPTMMRMVIMHFLENAQQHTREGKVCLSYYIKEGGLYVEVKDTGCGLPEDLKENIFTLLSDENTYLQDEMPGLGLSICKAVIDRAGGKIGAQDNDEDGRGTIFWCWVPVEIVN